MVNVQVTVGILMYVNMHTALVSE